MELLCTLNCTLLLQNHHEKFRIDREALESVTCEVKKIRQKRRIATKSGKGIQLLNIKIAVERPILKLGLPNFR